MDNAFLHLNKVVNGKALFQLDLSKKDSKDWKK